MSGCLGLARVCPVRGVVVVHRWHDGDGLGRLFFVGPDGRRDLIADDAEARHAARHEADDAH
ncbi:MAG: hypothetical protein J0G35_17270 [Acidobacteriales bacterium]|nr:hypothetical protein [Terriglobales bacterium]